MIAKHQRTVVVIGNGMVGHRFCEKLVAFDEDKLYRIVTFCEEPRAAYDRVGLTSFFAHRDAEKLMLANIEWYRENGIDLHIGQRATKIDRQRRIVTSDKGHAIRYDVVVLATGSYPFVPPVEGIHKPGTFVYRTIEDLQRIIAFGQKVRRCAIIGGGLLGLEAAKAAHDLGLETHIVESAPRLMPRQIDERGSKVLVKRIEDLGVHVHLNRATKEVRGRSCVEGVTFADGARLDVDMMIVSAGIRPRDELARECQLAVGTRGGVIVNDYLQASDANIYAIGEVALHGGTVYGLVAPGYEMAEIVAAHLTGHERRFAGTDVAAKLKLMGVDVASFGDHEAGPERATPLVYEDPFGGVYKKLLLDRDGTRLLGGVLVGDAADYSVLVMLVKSGKPLPGPAAELILGQRGAGHAARSLIEMGDDAQVCSCNNVSKGAIRAAIRAGGLATLDQVKQSARAGTSCGGCLPQVAGILHAELDAAGKPVNRHLCEHFAFTRQDLFEIAKVKRIRSFDELIRSHGQGDGCEICKPVVASILASLWNEHLLRDPHQTQQDTNDRFLANIQRGGLYSVIPRVPGGEITPERLMALGRVAKKYRLYAKITGAQRVALFGAERHQLPSIWQELLAAGFESGHAYGKAVRTVKSCVGTTWCRYGVQDSVGFAIRIEERYRGIRAPHKIKGGVSGCTRECAEAQGKDFGLVATEKGYNLYVGGNSGANPRRGDLLATDLDEDAALSVIDRFLMYYIQTADKLTRTAAWIDSMEGGIDQLKEVILRDKLGIGDELERQMQELVDSYRCEWQEVVADPELRRLFRQFVNTDDTEADVQRTAERGQCRPADWPGVPVDQVTLPNGGTLGDFAANGSEARSAASNEASARKWVKVGRVDDFPQNGGAAIKYGKVQIAVFRFTSRGTWYACQNMCPHRHAQVLASGLIGSVGDTPKIACPLHKKLFSLENGQCLSGEDHVIAVFPVKVHGEDVYLQLPDEDGSKALPARNGAPALMRSVGVKD